MDPLDRRVKLAEWMTAPGNPFFARAAVDHVWAHFFGVSLLEPVNQLHDVGKGNYRLIDACVYVLLTAPARLLQLMPAAMLFACLFALGALATRAELTLSRARQLTECLSRRAPS